MKEGTYENYTGKLGIPVDIVKELFLRRLRVGRVEFGRPITKLMKIGARDVACQTVARARRGARRMNGRGALCRVAFVLEQVEVEIGVDASQVGVPLFD